MGSEESVFDAQTPDQVSSALVSDFSDLVQSALLEMGSVHLLSGILALCRFVDVESGRRGICGCCLKHLRDSDQQR